jgi:hypothetical protein
MHSTPNPFLDDVFVGGISDSGLAAPADWPGVAPIHAEALRVLGDHIRGLAGGGGAIVLLRSPRAGSGKSHLLSRLAAARGDDHFFIPLDVNRDSHPSWVELMQGVLRASAQERQARPQMPFLDEMGRRLMAEAAADLILRGDVPTSDPAAAISMLKRDYLRVFDMRAGGSDVARWMTGNFNALLPLMGGVLGSRAAVDPDEAVAWLRVLSRFNAGTATERKAAVNAVVSLGEDSLSQAGAKQRLRSFCRLAGLVRPLVFVFDHIDALAAAKDDAMQLACVLGEFGRLKFGVGTILSVNGDVWSASFEGELPGALEDRLNGRVIDLGGIDVDEADALVRQRLGAAAIAPADMAQFMLRANLADVIKRRWGGEASPREVLRYAAATWDRMVAPPGAKNPRGPIAEPQVGESVKDYVSGKMPTAASLAEPSTLRPMVELVKGNTPAPAEPGKVDPGTIKQMGNISSLLRELKTRRDQFVPAGGFGDEPESGQQPPQMAAVDEVDDSSPLIQRFGEIRESLMKKRGNRLDLEALRRLLTLAGERFPVVESSEFKMSPGDEPTVMKWVFPGNEILFGFEPEHQFRYWQSLIKLAGRRAGSAAAAAGRLKLVVFSETDHPFSGAASVEVDELAAARGNYVDVIDVDAGMIASVIAADRVVCEMAKADEPVMPADAIRELAPQLDPLWRRITRPLAAKDAGDGEREQAV